MNGLSSTEASSGTPAKYRLGVVVAMLAMATLPLGVTGANLAFPAIEAHFAGSSRATLSWALSGYSIVMAAFTLLGGQLADRLGAYRMFLIGVGTYALFNVAAAMAPSAGLLVATRVVQGTGGALIVPASLAVALARCPQDRRAFTIGVWTASFPIGSSFAPTIASILLDLSGWRAVFGFTAIIGLLAFVLAMLLGNHAGSRPTAANAAASGLPDIFGITIGTTAVGLAALGIVQGRSWGWTAPPTLAALIGAVVLTPAFIARSKRHPRPLIELDLFRIRSFRVANIANVFISAIGTSTWLLWPLLMVNVWRFSQLKVGISMTPTPVIGAVGSILAARYAAKNGYRRLLIVGAFFLLASCVSFALLPTVTPNYWVGMFPGLVLMGLGMGTTFAPLNGAALVDIPVESIGRANAAFATGRALSGALGVAAVIAALSGKAKNPLANFDEAFTILAGIAVVAIALLYFSWERTAKRQAVPST